MILVSPQIVARLIGYFRYRPEVMKDGVMAQNNNPEVDVDVRKPNSVINQQILQLKLITNKLATAYRGIDVDWIDTGIPSPTFFVSRNYYCASSLYISVINLH